MKNTPKILFTKELSQRQKEYAKGLHIEDYSFIGIEYLPYSLSLAHRQLPYLIFPSQSAVNAVKNSFSPIDSQVIYAVGHKTAKMLNELWNNEIRIAEPENAMGIASLIRRENTDDFLYFCGKRRLNIMEDFLTQESKKYKLVEVYDTLNTPQKGLITSKYDVLCFCSPSAVDSYLSLYEIIDTQHIVAIGETTATVLRTYTKNIHTVKKASVEAMLDYLKTL